MIMGSLDKYCRLCAANVRPEQLLRLYEVRIDSFLTFVIIVGFQDGGVGETSHSAKLRNFLNMELSPGDR